jgi:hypothetical protein
MVTILRRYILNNWVLDKKKKNSRRCKVRVECFNETQNAWEYRRRRHVVM